MAIVYVKTIICLLCLLFALSLFLFEPFFSIKGQIKEAQTENAATDTKPENKLVDRFDKAVQQRFLTEPFFGMRRIQPAYPPNPRLEHFVPMNTEERESITDFQKCGWNVSLYLFGKRTVPKIIDGNVRKKFIINYRLNKPLPITPSLKEKQLPSSQRLLKKVKLAFTAFQTPNSPNENNYEFSDGEWFYVARPVRAVNQSCLKCHSDYIEMGKAADNQYKFRRRRIGDANGVIVYGFTKNK